MDKKGGVSATDAMVVFMGEGSELQRWISISSYPTSQD